MKQSMRESRIPRRRSGRSVGQKAPNLPVMETGNDAAAVSISELSLAAYAARLNNYFNYNDR